MKDAMPRRSSPLDPDGGPLERMALDLRQLRDNAPAGRPLKVDEVADQPGEQTSRAAIYAALSANRLVSRETLRAMVRAWAPGGLNDLPQWMRRRRECENELAFSCSTSEPPPLGNPRVPRDEGAIPLSLQLATSVSPPKSELIRDEMRRLWTAAGRPSLRLLALHADYAVSPATFSNALAGKATPSRRTMEAFLLGVDADEETSRTLLREVDRINGVGRPTSWSDGELVFADRMDDNLW